MPFVSSSFLLCRKHRWDVKENLEELIITAFVSLIYSRVSNGAADRASAMFSYRLSHLIVLRQHVLWQSSKKKFIPSHRTVWLLDPPPVCSSRRAELPEQDHNTSKELICILKIYICIVSIVFSAAYLDKIINSYNLIRK